MIALGVSNKGRRSLTRTESVRGLLRLIRTIRRAVYTTNVIESRNYSLRKILKGRSAFLHDEAVCRLIYQGLEQVSRKWTMPILHWKAALHQLAILFEDRKLVAALEAA